MGGHITNVNGDGMSINKGSVFIPELLENANLCYLALDEKACIVRVNDFWMETFGYSQMDVEGNYFGDFLNKDYLDFFKKEFQKSFSSKLKFSVCLRMKTKAEGSVNAELIGLRDNNIVEGVRIHCLIQNISKIKQRDNIFQKKSIHYSYIMDLLKVGVFEYVPSQKKFNFMNRYIRDLLGINTAEITELELGSFLTKDTRKRLINYRNELLKGEIIDEVFELQIINKGGRIMYIVITNNCQKDEDGNFHIFGVVDNITKIKQNLNRQEIKRQEDLCFLFNTAKELQKINTEDELYSYVGDKLHALIPEAIIDINSLSDDGSELRIECIRGVSGINMKKVSGKLMQNLLGFTIKLEPGAFDYAIPGKLTDFNKNIYDLSKQKIPEKISKTLEHMFKLEHFVEAGIGTPDKIMAGAAILLKKGVVIEDKKFIETFLREVSSTLVRINIRKQLKESESLYRSLVENSDNLILRFDKKLNVLYKNNAFKQKVSYSIEGEKLSQNIENYFSGDKLKKFKQVLKKINKEKNQQIVEMSVSDDEDQTTYDWYFYPETINNKLETVLVFAHDVTKRKILEKEIMDSFEFRKKLYSILAHDLRTPFNSVIGFLDLLDSGYEKLDDTSRKNYIHIIKDSAEKSFDLLNSILMWSKERESIDDDNTLECNVNKIFDDISSLNSAKISDKNICLDINLTQKVLVKVNNNMMAAILRNIVSNAIKFSFPTGKIVVTAAEKDENWIISVKDFGIGMNAGMEGNMDIINNKISRPGTAGEEGNGLGLCFVKDFVLINHGSMWCESEKGKGTTVFVKFKKATKK